jgi:hypothetical protein
MFSNKTFVKVALLAAAIIAGGAEFAAADSITVKTTTPSRSTQAPTFRLAMALSFTTSLGLWVRRFRAAAGEMKRGRSY